MAFMHWNCSCSCDESHTIRSPQSLQRISLLLKDFSFCGIFSLASRNEHPTFHKQVGAMFLVRSCPCIFPLPVTSLTLALHSKFACDVVEGDIDSNSRSLKFPPTHRALRICCGFGELSKANQASRMATAQADGL